MNYPTPDYSALDEARSVRHEAREIRMEREAHEECVMHLAHTARLDRAEIDIQTLFSKVGEALGLMHKVDARVSEVNTSLAGLNGRIYGGSIIAGSLVGVIVSVVLHFMK
jgi:hypothetical protein